MLAPWLVLGDFNDILLPNEVKGGNFYPRKAEKFSNHLDSCSLSDIGAKGPLYTWRRAMRNNIIVSKRLDRAVANTDWRDLFSEASVMNLFSAYSDHNPIGVFLGGLHNKKGSRPFRLEAAWTQHPQFPEVVRNAWRRTLDTCINGRLLKLEGELRKDLNETLAQEEMLWFQKSREQWVKHGNKNTKFFHAQTVVRRKRNKIEGLVLSNGDWCTDEVKLEDEAVEYFTNMFQSTNRNNADLDTVDLPTLDKEEAEAMTKEVSKEEFKESLGKYLGVPLLKGRTKCADFNYILQKLNSKLMDWKSKLLNRAGRVTLAKAVLNAIPVYTMQSLWVPEQVCRNIDRQVRKFIWGSQQGKRGLHLVNWERVTLPKARGGLGVREARATNTALLGKAAWSILRKENKLWVRLFEGKYLNGTNLYFYHLNQKDSYVSKGIVKAFRTLESGFISKIGDGEDTNLWLDTWTKDGPLINFIQEEVIPMLDLNTKVSSIIANKQWALQGMDALCPPDVLEDIERIPLPTHSFARDILIWGHTPNGSYSAKSGASRGMGANSMCLRCRMHDETILHCLRDCPVSKQIWAHFGFANSPQFNEENVLTWIYNLTGMKNLESSDQDIKFLCVLYNIWKSRNAWKSSGGLDPVIKRTPLLVSWRKPREGFWKLNTDGSALGNPGPAGVGGILRNDEGAWVGGFSEYIGVRSNMFAELLAIKKGLMLSLDLGLRRLEVESDCLECIKLIKQDVGATHQLGIILQDIRELMKPFESISINHIFREANQCADGLARIGSKNAGMKSTWELPPSEIRLALLADAADTVFERG
ncbi:putative ribonuclease H protein At1g65750 family [Senna tora]|uniref:Putative ribonuclease H protein At1g65750 family n=1 Tax=Senna tora TaxID=362788 RepID=A0A834XG43_9FABA|nr:putative ribonuclease H protein At1g65750 family [Senna tora]